MTTRCPVPPEQRPLEEFSQLKSSWFFAWPSENFISLTRPLGFSWLLLLPVSLLIASGSVPLRHDLPRLVTASAVAAIMLPFLLLIRQWLGWAYVNRRLLSNQIEYEESGWYDGQTWEKPLSWRQRDLLVAQYQVKPILIRLQKAMGIAAVLMMWGAILCQVH
ncbi:Ycf36 protein (chromatophore) [Paulinella micropora]|uniref:Ycf36 protein n=1 Tax=Paulinella micropora TaxID=1928728 RepID=A0A1L5YCY2_9EUKA|nr:hypothetical protein PCKR_797 [Paulinella micropora]AQX45328.1 hypothetical protein PFK_797 [Paulinella micropora]BBL86547.1 Ycf36 protein [Paulinella micropora]